jgi:hypothetical protein
MFVISIIAIFSYNDSPIPIRYARRNHLRLLLIHHRRRLPRHWVRSTHPIAVDRGDVHSCGCADDEALEAVAPADFEGNHGVWRLLQESVEFALGFEDSVTCVSLCSACTLDSNTLTRLHRASQWILAEIP